MSGTSKKRKTYIGVNFIDPSVVQELFDELKQTPARSFDSYLIAYIDFLGMKDKMKKESSYASLRKLQALLEGVRQKASFIEKINSIDEFEIKVFSDNIVIALQIKKDMLARQIFSLVNIVSLLQFEALFQFGFPLRGGITIGELYIDDSVVWGTGLIEAYQIEDKLANYPRVIISKKVIETYEKQEDIELDLSAFMRQDTDGYWFVHYLIAAPNIKLIPVLSNNLAEVVSLCAKEDDRVKQKINWLISYFNNFCREFKDRGDYDKYVISFI